MKSVSVLVLLLMGLFLLLSPAYADDSEAVTPTGFGIGIGDWITPTFSGSVKAGMGGTEMALTSNLGFSSQSIVVPHFWYRWAHGQIFDFRYNQYSQTSATVLGVPETFQGVTIPAGSPVSSQMKIQWGDLSYELPIAYDQFPPQESYLNALINIKALRGTFNLYNSSGLVGQHPPITVPFPMFGLHGMKQIFPETSVEFKVSGIRAGFEDALGYSFDLEAGFNQTFFQQFHLSGKYRYMDFFNRDAQDNRFSFRLYGPEVDASVNF